MENEFKLFKKIDFSLIFIVLLICVYGVVIISSSTLNHRLGAAHFVRSQITSVLIGLMAMVGMILINYRTLKRLAVPIYVISNALLLIVLLVGVGQEDWGASRWIRIGGIGFQPADFVKIGLIICLAKIVDDQQDHINQPFTLFKILGFMLFPLSLIMMQPDLGTTLVVSSILVGVLFMAGIRYKYIFVGAITGLLSMPIFWNILEDYQRTRILIFLNPEIDPMGAGYQIIQSKRAVGAGMLRGQGLYSGTQSQYGFLPERHTDFVFSVIAEELGFIGALILLFLFIAMLIKLVYISMNAKDDFGMFLVVGVVCMFAVHIFINVGMAIGLMPVTGKPLPFISHGGTFMLTNFMALGLALNVYMRRDVINF